MANWVTEYDLDGIDIDYEVGHRHLGCTGGTEFWPGLQRYECTGRFCRRLADDFHTNSPHFAAIANVYYHSCAYVIRCRTV